MKKDDAVELLRVIACLCTIGVHTGLSVSVNGQYDVGRLYLACLYADGVAMFWLVMGFFLFGQKSYRKLLVKTVKRIILPMFLLSVFLFFMAGWLIEGKNVISSIQHTREEYFSVLLTLLTWRNPVKYAGHLWYLYIYVLVILVFPVLNAFTEFLDADKSRERWFMIISFGVLILNDITNNKLSAFSHYSINGLIPASIEIIWGHILYRYKNCFKKRQFVPMCLVAFGILNGFREYIQLSRYVADASNYIMYWYSSIGLVCSVLIAIVCFSLVDNWNGTFGKRVIEWLGAITFPVYLVHTTIIKVMNRIHVPVIILKMSDWLADGFVMELIYTMAIIIVVFMVSLLVSLVLKRITNMMLSNKI